MTKTEYLIDPAKLKSLRRTKGWSRKQLADEAGQCDPAYIFQLEASPHNCGVNKATRLAQALGCTIEDLTGTFPKTTER